MKKRILIVTCMMMIGMAGCGRNEAENFPTEESGMEEGTLALETEAGFQESENAYEVDVFQFRKDELCDISYPQISGWKLEEKQQEWNVIFENYVEDAVANLGENDSAEVVFTVEEQTEELLSLSVRSYYNYEGSAHPSAGMTSFNINMQTGEKVVFADMADPKETAELLFNGTGGYTVLDDYNTMKDILEYNYILMEPTEEALENSLKHFDQDVEDYGENETMGYSFRRNGKVCLIFYVSHAMGDYAVVELEE